MAELARIDPNELSRENPVFRWLSNLGGLTPEEKLQRAQARREALGGSFVRSAPVAAGMRPQATAVAAPNAVGQQVAVEPITPAPAAAATPPGQSQGAVGFRPRPVQLGAPGGAMTVNLSPQDQAIKQNMQAIDDTIAGGVVPTPERASQIAVLRRQAGFLRGGTDRVPVGPDGLPISGRGARYSITAAPDVAATFTDAVAPGEYSQEAMAARGLQRQQFLERNAARPMMPAAPQPLPAPQSLGEAFVRRGALREIESARQGAKTEAEITGFRMNAANAAEQNRIAAERNLIAAGSEASAAGMRQSQMDLNAALARKSDAETAAGKFIKLQRKVPTGETDIAGVPIMRTEEFLYDRTNDKVIDPNAQVGPATNPVKTSFLGAMPAKERSRYDALSADKQEAIFQKWLAAQPK